MPCARIAAGLAIREILSSIALGDIRQTGRALADCGCGQ
jgi:hypothetical protein